MNKAVGLALFITFGAALVGGLMATPVIQEVQAACKAKDPGGPLHGPDAFCIPTGKP
jgi:hypothetical protein